MEFHWADYVVFGTSLGLSLLIGVIFLIVDCLRGAQNNKEYLLGGKRMNTVAVGLSMIGSIMNAVLLMGFPVQIYSYGTQFALSQVAFSIATLITAHVFLPFYRQFDNISVYEYLEKRFDSVIIRVFSSAVFAIASILFLAVVVYSPALAVMQVTGFEKTISIVVCGVVCLLYVSMGGMKAVVWTDALQMVIILVGMLLLTISGALKAGGGQEIWQYTKETGKAEFTNFDPHPFAPTTFWTQCFGFIFLWLPTFTANQMIVQRFHAVSKTIYAQIGVYIMSLVSAAVACMVCMLALTMNYYYREADPLQCKQIKSPDQIVPLFLMEVLGSYHGLPGLVVAAFFAAALSSVSSTVHSLATVVVEDFIKPVMRAKRTRLSEKTYHIIARILSILFGILAIGISFSADKMGDTIVHLQLRIYGTVLAPLFGVFFLAMFCPCANSWGAILGLLCSLIFNFWLSVGNIMKAPRLPPKGPIGTNCTAVFGNPFVSNMTTPQLSTSIAKTSFTLEMTTEATDSLETFEVPDFYRIAYAWHGLLGIIVCVGVGLIVSLLANGAKALGKSYDVDKQYLHPCVQICSCNTGSTKEGEQKQNGKSIKETVA